MQTILGAGGVIARNLAEALPAHTERVRLVSRHVRPQLGGEELMAADLLDAARVREAVKGSQVVYLCAGLPYELKVWREQWPRLMDNVIAACVEERAKLVFFDNVYLYGKVDGWMTEQTPVNPSSAKGELRARIVARLWDTVRAGSLEALVARAADFYGPATPLSLVNVLVFQRLARGKRAQHLLTDSRRHSFNYAPDAGKATALLGNTPSAFGQTWHLPADSGVLTLKELTERAAEEFGVSAKSRILPRWMIKLAGLFDKAVAESVEMLYQNEFDYLFDSSKFDAAFDFPAVSYAEGIHASVEYYRRNV